MMIASDSYFLPYQEAWIEDESTLKLSEKSRRIGLTFASSYRMFQKCMTRPGLTQWVSSRDMLTAQELIRDYVARWCKLANVAAAGMYGDNVQVIDTDKNIKAFVCDFPNGARIVSLSSTPEAFAGKGGDVFLDEVDLHQDSGRLIDMAMPCITWGNQLEAVSAYRVNGSSQTPWARMVTEAKGANGQGASLHRTSIYDAVEQGLAEKIAERTGKPLDREDFISGLRARCRTLAAWQSQYELIVQDAGGRLLTLAQIMGCEMSRADIERELLDKYPDAPRFGGYDVARRLHASAWHEFAQIGVSLVLARREVFRNRPFDEQEAWIRARMTDAGSPRITRMAIDSTGMGMQMAERMAKAFPGRVDEVNLASGRRHELCMMVADRFENRRIVIPADDQLRADLNAPLKSVAANGGLRIVIPAFNTEDGELSHADEFMATVLAVSAAGAGAAVPAARAVSTRREGSAGRRSRRSFVA